MPATRVAETMGRLRDLRKVLEVKSQSVSLGCAGNPADRVACR
jgi:hypothetical protein